MSEETEFKDKRLEITIPAKKISELEEYAEFMTVYLYEACHLEYLEWIGEEAYIVFLDISIQNLERLFLEIIVLANHNREDIELLCDSVHEMDGGIIMG